jgi:hypothetical protein
MAQTNVQLQNIEEIENKEEPGKNEMVMYLYI